MKKMIKIILCGFLLSGCTVQNNPSTTPKPVFQLSSYEETELQKLMGEGNYFTPFVNDLDDITWTIDEQGISIDLNNPRKIHIQVNYDGEVNFDYLFNNISFIYEAKGISTLVDLILSVDPENSYKGINLDVSLDQEEAINLVYDSQQNRLALDFSDYSQLDMNIDLQDEIVNQIFDEYINFNLFRNALYNFESDFLCLINLGPLYYNANLKKNSTIFSLHRSDIKNQSYDFSPQFHNQLFLVTDDYFYVPNWNTTKIYNTASILFYLNEDIGHSSYFQEDNIIQALLSIKPNINCIYQKCSTNLTSNEVTFTMDKLIGGYYFQGLSTTKLNQQISVLFKNAPTINIDQSLLRDDGIVQIKENGAYFTQHKNYYINYEAFHKLYIDVIENSKDTLVLHVTPYRVDFNWLSNSIDCYIKTPSGEILYPDFIFNDVNMNEYIVNYLDKFQSWKLTLERNDDADFYRIISANKLRQELK